MAKAKWYLVNAEENLPVEPILADGMTRKVCLIEGLPEDEDQDTLEIQRVVQGLYAIMGPMETVEEDDDVQAVVRPILYYLGTADGFVAKGYTEALQR